MYDNSDWPTREFPSPDATNTQMQILVGWTEFHKSETILFQKDTKKPTKIKKTSNDNPH